MKRSFAEFHAQKALPDALNMLSLGEVLTPPPPLHRQCCAALPHLPRVENVVRANSGIIGWAHGHVGRLPY